MRTHQKKKEEKQSVTQWFYGFFNGQTDLGNYCTPDQCFLNNQQAFSSTNLVPQVNSYPTIEHMEINNSTHSNILDSINFSEFFPPELIQLITDAAQQGLLISMLITLANEGVTDYLKGFHYHPDKIYWINQGIRALLLIALGTSAGTAIAVPVAGYVLNSYCGLSKEGANYISTGIVVGINLLKNPTTLMEASIAIGTSVGTSWIGSTITKSGYNFVRDTFFSAKEVTDAVEPDPQPIIQLT